MERKTYISRAVKIISLILSLVLITYLLQFFLFSNITDEGTKRIKSFYSLERNSLDCVVIGSSEVIKGYSAGLAYDEFGYTSYPFANNSATILNWKSQLIEVLKFQNPDVILVEVGGALYENKEDLLKEYGARIYIENMPLSKNKIDTVNAYDGCDDKLSYIFPIIKYHSIPTPGEAKSNIYETYSFFNENSRLMGFCNSLGKLDRVKELEKHDKYGKLDLNKYVYKKLIEFLNYCKDNKIDNLVFTSFPHVISDKITREQLYRCNTMQGIVEKYGYDFLNFGQDDSDIGLDHKNDFYDSRHLNIYGAKKMTSHIGRILTEKYGLKHRKLTDKSKMIWDNCSKYTKLLFNYIDKCYKDNKKNIDFIENEELIKTLDDFSK